MATLTQIRDMRAHAKDCRDLATMELCDAALRGDADAREEVDRMIHGDGNDPDVLPW